MAKILVTGGAGFIGFNIAKSISENAENEIYIVDDLSKGKKDDEFLKLLERDNVTFYEADLTDLDAYSKIGSKYDQIYHLAAIVGVKRVTEDPVLTLRVNALSTIYLLDYVKKMGTNPKVLFASSCENYAGSIKCCNVPFPTPEDVPLCIEDIYNPRWSYAVTKILGEIAFINYSRQYGFNTTIVRYHNIYGPRMGIHHVIPEFIIRLKKNSSNLEMHGGDQYRSFCYVSDAAKMTIKLMNNNSANGLIINVGNDKEYIKIDSIAKNLSELMQITPKLIEMGAPEGSVNKRMPDLKLIKDLGDYIADVEFSDGLISTLKWYESRYK